MKPNFALNLSHEGISLLHRAKAGWLRVGGVSLDDPDLTDKLKMLRSTAADLESGGLTSKLVIPNSQILYTDVAAPGPGTADRLAQIRDGLVGLTPYDVNDLVFDYQLEGTTAQVAVVARDTLQEAEAFAAKYRFNPVSFVAIPVNSGFDGEPFFGATHHASTLLESGEEIEPDTESMTVLERSDTKKKPPKAKPAPPPAKAEAEPAQVNAEPEPPLSLTDPLPPSEPLSASVSAEPQPSPQPDPEPTAELDTPAPVTFSSRRTTPDTARAEPPPPAPIPQATSDVPPEPAVGFSHNSALDIDDIPEMPAWRSATKGDITPMPMTSAQTADVVDPGDRRRSGRKNAKVSGAAIAGTFGKIGKGTATGVRRMRDRQAAVEASDKEADALTVFGARGNATIGGKPRHLGLILTVLLLVALGILALWSTFFLGDSGTTDLGALTDEPQIAAPAPEPSPAPAEPEPEPPGELAAALPAAVEPTQPEAPPADTPVNPVDAAVEEALTDALPAEPEVEPEDSAENIDVAALPEPSAPDLGTAAPPDRITQPPPTRAQAEARYAATGIWQLDPDPLPGATGGDRLETLNVATLDPTISTKNIATIPNVQTLLNDQRPPVLTPPAALGTRFDLDDRGLVRATPDGALSPAGVRIFAGVPPVIPGIRPGTVLPAPAPLPIAEAPLPGAEQPEAAQPEPALAEPTQPETPPTEAEPAETLAVETPVPEASGPEAAETAQSLDPEIERLRAIRPQARPDALQESGSVDRLGGFSQTELASIRPAIRPPSPQEQAAPEPEPAAEAEGEQDAVQPETGTEQAVLASLLPASRPRDFARTVERARPRTNTETTNPDATENTAAARVPSIPTRASVAKQATERNAINLSKINLIGVYGSATERRALVRLKSGRYVKVEVGDRIDGGRVAAIGSGELRYIKGGRNITLKLPKS